MPDPTPTPADDPVKRLLRSRIPSGWSRILAEHAEHLLRPDHALIATSRLRPLSDILRETGPHVDLLPLTIHHHTLIVAVAPNPRNTEPHVLTHRFVAPR